MRKQRLLLPDAGSFEIVASYVILKVASAARSTFLWQKPPSFERFRAGSSVGRASHF